MARVGILFFAVEINLIWIVQQAARAGYAKAEYFFEYRYAEGNKNGR